MTTSRIRSKGSSEASSRLPTTRVTTRTRRKTMAARMTMSMAQGKMVSVRCRAASRVLPSSKAATSARRPTVVGLTCQCVITVEGLASPEGREGHGEAPAAAVLGRRRRVAGVQRDAVEPVLVEHELGVRERVVARGEPEPGLEQQPAAQARRRLELHERLRRGHRRRRGALAVGVEQRRHAHRRDEEEQAPAQPDVPRPAAQLDVAVMREVRVGPHGAGFAVGAPNPAL